MFVVHVVLCYNVFESHPPFLTRCVIQGNLKLRVFFSQVLALAIREVCIAAGAVLGNVQAFASKLVNALPMPLLHESNN